MNEHIGISFSESAFVLSEAKGEAIQSVTRIDYPFHFGYDQLFSEKIKQILSEHIQKVKKTETETISAVLPLNYTHFKRVALPIESEKDLARIQVEWEFKNYLSGKLSEYKIIYTQTEFLFAGYREWLFLAIKKSVLEALAQLAEQNGLVLQRVVPVNQVISQCLPNKEDPTLVFKIDSGHLETYLFVNGLFYDSYLDVTRDQQAVVEICKKRYMDVQLTLERFTALTGDMLNCFIYGDGLTPELAKQLQADITGPISRLRSGHETNSENGLEAVEVLLSK